MDRKVDVYAVSVNHINGTVNELRDEDSKRLASMALTSFTAEKTINISDETYVPFHAVDTLDVVVTSESRIIYDKTCTIGCEYVSEPTIDGMTPLTVETGQEFDPTEGVSAYDGNGKKLSVEVNVKGE